MDDEALAARRHHAGHDPPVDRPGRPDDLIDDLKRALKAAAEGEAALRWSSMTSTATRPTATPAASRSTPAKPTVVFIHGALNDHSVWILQTR